MLVFIGQSVCYILVICVFFFFFQAEDGIRDRNVTGVQTCALPILGVNNHTKMYVTYTRIYGWSDYGGESSYQPGYRLENMMWMTLLVYDYIIPGENNYYDTKK